MKYVETLEGLKTVPEIMMSNLPAKGMVFYLEIEEGKNPSPVGGIIALEIPDVITAIQCQIADLDLEVRIGILTTLLAIAMEKKNLSEGHGINNGEQNGNNQN